MNERVKDVNPNVYDIWVDAAAKVNPLKAGGDWQKEFVINFAELMVEEFQTLIKDTYLNTAPEHRDCLLVLDAKVEEHFGIKE